MIKQEYTTEDGKKIEVTIPKQRQMQVVYQKAGVEYDAKNDSKLVIKDILKFNYELIKAATGMTDEELGELYETDYRKIGTIANKLLHPSQEEVNFLQRTSQETKTE